MSDFQPGVTSREMHKEIHEAQAVHKWDAEQREAREFNVGDRVRYVRNPEISEEMWAVEPNRTWQRRTERDSIIVGLPDDVEGRYPDYRLVTIFEPGDDTTWSDRDFWFAPAERLTLAGERTYQYQVFDTKRSRMVLDVPDEDVSLVAEQVAGPNTPNHWILRRRVVGPWEEVN